MRLVAFAVAVALVVPVRIETQEIRRELDNLPFLRSYTSQRVSSADTSGANDDGNGRERLMPGEVRTIARMTGPGIITHMWFTINSTDRWHLKNLVLRIYWDGQTNPSVEAPIGDFFGLGLGKYLVYESGPLSVGSQKALNSYFPMPFQKGAVITVANEGDLPTLSLYYNIDWEKHSSLPASMGYFHAQYRQATPFPGWTTDWTRNGDTLVNRRPNKDGAGNYLIMEAEGRGHFVGVTHSILQNQGDWWGRATTCSTSTAQLHRRSTALARRTITWAPGVTVAAESTRLAASGRPSRSSAMATRSTVETTVAQAGPSTAFTPTLRLPSRNPFASRSSRVTPITVRTTTTRWRSGIRPCHTSRFRRCRRPQPGSRSR